MKRKGVAFASIFFVAAFLGLLMAGPPIFSDTGTPSTLKNNTWTGKFNRFKQTVEFYKYVLFKADGALDFESGSTVDFQTGSDLDFENGSDVNYQSGSNTTFDNGATETHNNDVTYTGTLTLGSGPLSIDNMVDNQQLAIWSGATCSAASTSAAPDGWRVYDQTNTGATRYGFSDSTLISTAATPYGRHGYSMYVQSFDSTHGTYDEIGYASSVSNQASWYQKFRGKTIQWGAMVYTDSGTAGATNFIRPYIVTCTNKRDTPGVTAFATYGSYASGGWQFLSATTTVPNAATALEVGFEIKASTGLTGESAFVLAPTLLSGATVPASPTPKRNEEIWFTNAVAFDTNGSAFDLGSGTSSFDVEGRTAGKIPANVDAIYVIYQGEFSAVNHQSCFRTDTLHTTGATLYSSAPTGAMLYSHALWVKCDDAGDFDLYTDNTVNGVSIFCTGAVVK